MEKDGCSFREWFLVQAWCLGTFSRTRHGAGMISWKLDISLRRQLLASTAFSWWGVFFVFCDHARYAVWSHYGHNWQLWAVRGSFCQVIPGLVLGWSLPEWANSARWFDQGSGYSDGLHEDQGQRQTKMQLLRHCSTCFLQEQFCLLGRPVPWALLVWCPTAESKHHLVFGKASAETSATKWPILASCNCFGWDLNFCCILPHISPGCLWLRKLVDYASATNLLYRWSILKHPRQLHRP